MRIELRVCKIECAGKLLAWNPAVVRPSMGVRRREGVREKSWSEKCASPEGPEVSERESWGLEVNEWISRFWKRKKVCVVGVWR